LFHVVKQRRHLRHVDSYIDLNPYRADMVDRVEDGRWCGYASGVAGNRQ